MGRGGGDVGAIGPLGRAQHGGPAFPNKLAQGDGFIVAAYQKEDKERRASGVFGDK